MPNRNRSSRPTSQQIRRSVAGLAARLMAEDGIADYGVAKRKAARQLHLPESEGLPNNAEIEAELRIYQSLYQADEQRARIERLRRVALKTMRLLKGFSPYLVGHVLEGTAGRYASVDLVLFTDAGKDVELFLLDQGIEYRHVESRRPASDGSEMMFECDIDSATVRIGVLPADEERLHRRSPHSGRSSDRASLSALESLLAGSP